MRYYLKDGRSFFLCAITEVWLLEALTIRKSLKTMIFVPHSVFGIATKDFG